MSTEALAREAGIQEKYIKQSIAMVETFKALNTMEELEASQVEVVVFNKEVEKIAIHEALKAKKVDEAGEEVPDHEIRLLGFNKIVNFTEILMGWRGRFFSAQNTPNENIINPRGGV